MLLSPCVRTGRDEQSDISNSLNGLHNNNRSNDSVRINNSTHNHQYTTTGSTSQGEQRREHFNRPLNLDLLGHTNFCSASGQSSCIDNNANKVDINSSVNKGASTRITSSVNFANDLSDEFGASSSTLSTSYGQELTNAREKLRHRLRDKSSTLLSSDRPSSAGRIQPHNSAILARRHSSVSPQSSSNPLPFRRNTMSYCSQVSAISLSSTKLTLDNLLDNVISSVQTKLNGTDVSSETQPLLFNNNNNYNTNTSCGINSSSSACMNQSNLNNNANCYYNANLNGSNSTTTANNNSTAANKPSCIAKPNGAMNSNTNAVLNNNNTGNEDFIQAGDFLKYKVKLRDATMHQEDLLDPELVQVQTFKKARPESGWASILLNAAIRVAFIPFLYSWWRTEVSRMQYAMLLGAWFMASWNIKRYFMSQLPIVSNSKFSVYELELLCPSFYLFLLTFTYCHIHNARKRTPVSNNSSSYSTVNTGLHNVSTSPNISRDVDKGNRKNIKQVFPRRTTRRQPLRSSILTPSVSIGNNRSLIDRNLSGRGSRTQSDLAIDASSIPRLQVIPSRTEVQFLGPNLSPINDQEREENDVESVTNNEDRDSVSSLEEHVQTTDNTGGDINQARANAVNLQLGQNEFARQTIAERGSYDESQFDGMNGHEDNSAEDTNTTVSRASPASQLLDLGSSRDENDLTAVESDHASRIFVATQSSSLDVSLEQGAISIDMPSTSHAPDLDDNQKSKESSGDAVDFLEAMVQSSVSVFHMLPYNNTSGQFNSVNSSRADTIENRDIIGIGAPSQREETTFSDDLSTHAEIGTSVEVTTAELDSETPPWTSRQLSTQSSSNVESKQSQQQLHSTVKQSMSVPLESFYDQSTNYSDPAVMFYTANQTGTDVLGSNTVHEEAKTSDTNIESDIPRPTSISLPLDSFDYGSRPRSTSTSSLTIGRNRSIRKSVSSVVRLGPSKVTITPSRKRQNSLTSVNSRSSFLHKSIVKYLGDLEQKAREASFKENNAQLSLRDKFLRFLIACKMKLFGELIESQKSILASPVTPSSVRKTAIGHPPGDDVALGPTRSGGGADGTGRLENGSPSIESEEEEENDHGNILEESEEEEDEDVNDGEGQEEETGGSSIEEVEEQNDSANVNLNGENFSTTYDHYPGADEPSHHMYNRSANAASTGAAGTSMSQTPEKTVKIITWNQMGKCNKANLTAEQVVDMIVTRADSIRNSNFYLAFGVFCAAFISGSPFIYRYFAIRDFIMFEDVAQLIAAADLEKVAATNFIRMETYLSYFCALSSFMTCTVFFLLLAAAERTYLQRYYYSKYLYRLTSSRKARKCEIPHFRLTKVRNIKMWLYIRFKLKAHGPQKTVEVIVSNCLLFCILSISCFCFKLLEQHSNANDSAHQTSSSSSNQCSSESAANSPGAGGSGNSNEAKITYPNLASWIAIMWCLALGSLLLRFITIGTKVNKKYSNTAMLTTERINLSLRMENKPEKREEYFLADRVLKLACRLISEVESPFKVSGLVMNSALYNIMRVIVLSAVSAVMSEILGFKLKLWKI
ncbi:uncharacterized protein LOC142336804 isoform X2 [Convolutriloba macropyga]|uniref:uncharacterized protein LOC142336804 isoform X2 n=1 Tax=Convolutriloba macropyga TaxID=536237 RepID=UPI003F5214C5